MGQTRQNDGEICHSHEELFTLVMEAVAPWAFAAFATSSERDNRAFENWCIRDISIGDDQALICIMHVTSRSQYTALVCCLGDPEVVAVSYKSGNLGMLNPYLDCGNKLETDLDGPGCWNVFSVTFCAEPGAQAVRYLRKGEVCEVRINRFDAFSIVDWESNQPVEEYLGVKVNGVWKKPVVVAIPYTIDYVTACWRKAVYRDDGLRSRWNRWITAAFVELCGADRAILQQEMMAALAVEKDPVFYRAFTQERRKFLDREKRPLDELLLKV